MEVAAEEVGEDPVAPVAARLRRRKPLRQPRKMPNVRWPRSRPPPNQERRWCAAAIASRVNMRSLRQCVGDHRTVGERIYGVVDAARDSALAFAARDRFGERIESLFEGESAPFLTEVAPYMVRIDPQSGYLDLWSEHLGRSAGILLLTPAEPDELRRHLRQIFIVTDEENKEYFFRYYDPRVLRPFLPTCTAAEAAEFFGSIRHIFAESAKSGNILRCEAKMNGASMVEEALSAPQPVGVSGDLRR